MRLPRNPVAPVSSTFFGVASVFFFFGARVKFEKSYLATSTSGSKLLFR